MNVLLYTMTKLQDANVLNRGRDSGINLIFVLAGRTGVVTGGRQEVMEMAEWKRNTIVKAKGRIPKPGQRILRSVCAVCLHSGE